MAAGGPPDAPAAPTCPDPLALYRRARAFRLGGLRCRGYRPVGRRPPRSDLQPPVRQPRRRAERLAGAQGDRRLDHPLPRGRGRRRAGSLARPDRGPRGAAARDTAGSAWGATTARMAANSTPSSTTSPGSSSWSRPRSGCRPPPMSPAAAAGTAPATGSSLGAGSKRSPRGGPSMSSTPTSTTSARRRGGRAPGFCGARSPRSRGRGRPWSPATSIAPPRRSLIAS